MTPPLRATSDLVAVAWLRGVSGLDPTKVATTLPEDVAGWGEAGFVQVRAVGGTPDLYLPAGRPVLQVDCWAVKPDTGRPLWNVAALLAQAIVDGTRDESTMRRPLALPAGYPGAQVMQAYPLVDPHRIEGDPGSYARFRMDLAMHWVEVGQ